MTPRQRQPGQTGGFGGQASNKSRSLARGGTPSGGGGGQGPRPPRKGCRYAPELLAIILTPLTIAAVAAGVTVHYLFG